MKTRISSTLWIIALFVGAMLAGGYVAEHLQTLERSVLRTWQQKLTNAGNTKADNVASYLETQQKILQEIGGDSTLQTFLAQSQTTQIPTTPDITRALDDIANLKYSLNHTYIFDGDSQLLVRQPEARTLPLNIRENLSLAYRTGLKKYMFFATFENKTWFIASRRIQDQDNFLGYSAFMLEASAAMDPLRNTAFKWQDIDFNLARRSGDENVFIVDWQKNRPTTTKYNLEETNIPIFSGTANTFQAVELTNNKELLMYISSVPTFPFWQHMSSIPTDEALADVRTTRMFYLFGLGVLLLFVFALMFGFIRRIVDPNLPVIPETLTGHKPNIDKTKTARQRQETTAAQKEGGLFSSPINSTRGKAHAARQSLKTLKQSNNRPKKLLSQITGAMPWARRPLSEEEKAAMQAPPTPTPSATQQTPDTPPQTKGESEDFTRSQADQAQKEKQQQADAANPTAEDLAEQQRQEKENAQQRAEQEKVKQIRNCLENERYRLYFQPILETASKEKVMFETLLRLVNEKGDLMQPGEFFPLAIKHGFVDEVDDMVIVASLRRHMEILTQGKKNMLSINLSYGAFNSLNFMDTFKEGLKSGKLKPELLNFELNSREIIEDDSAMTFVREMQKSGAKFSVDFFGEPEKTVKAAKKLKFDYIKLDCLKFDGLSEGDAKQVERFKRIVDASKEHNLPIIAEKIEGKPVLWLCEKLGVPYVQGFYLAEPSPKLSLGW